MKVASLVRLSLAALFFVASVLLFAQLLTGPLAPSGNAQFAIALGLGIAAQFLVFFETAAWKSKRAVMAFVALAIVARIVLLISADPLSLSDDINRYVFEGVVLSEGQSPWRFAPDSKALDDVSEAQGVGVIRDGVNHPQIATIYPPLGEALFALSSFLHPSRLSWRLMATLFDFAIAFLLWQRSVHLGHDPRSALLWLTCPLVLLEVSVSAHLDVIGAAFVVYGLDLFRRKREGWGAAAIVASIATKAISLPLVPVFLTRRGFIGGLICALILIGLASPFLLEPEEEAYREAPEAIQKAPPRRGWDDLLGRYRIAELGGEPVVRHIGGSGRILGGDAVEYYEQRADGSFTLIDSQGAVAGLVWVSADRQWLFPTDDSPRALYGMKTFESPIMGAQQYATRWSAHSPLARYCADLLADPNDFEIGPRLARRYLFGAALLIALILAWFKVERDHASLWILALVLCGSATIYPWYFLWIAALAAQRRSLPFLAWATISPVFYLGTASTEITPTTAEIIVHGTPIYVGIALGVWAVIKKMKTS